MNLLFLRGQVPTDRNYNEIIFDKLEECDDVWTHLVYNLLKKDDYGEIWYWGRIRKKKWKHNFIERWIESFEDAKDNFTTDVILCRGGFSQYHYILNKFPDAFKVYYGAGQRFLPQKGFLNYDLILQDSPQQLETCKNIFSDVRSELFIKPAPDNLFFPIEKKKTFDVCFPANGRQERMKGHDFVFSTFPKDLKILNLGNEPNVNKVPKEIERKRVLKPQMPQEYAKCKMGIVCCSSEIDSCPRVISEMLACNLPLVVLDETRFWKEKYISEKTGIISSKEDFWKNVDYMLNHLEEFSPREYYLKNLSMKKASEYLRNLIGKTKC